jgi:hypothetical protein
MMAQSNPAKKPDPGPKPHNDQIKDWVKADQAFKESRPENISDGGKGVSN